MIWVERITKMKIILTVLSCILFLLGLFIYKFVGYSGSIFDFDSELFAPLALNNIILLFIIFVIINVTLTAIKKDLLDITKR